MSALPSLIAALLKSGEFSDITLTCQGEEFKLHKAVVCPQSSVMNAAFTGQFKEAQSGTLKADGFDVDTVQRMVDFLYTGNYDVKFPGTGVSVNQLSLTETGNPESTAPVLPGSMTAEKATLLCHVRANAIGNYYDIQDLAALANSRIDHMFQTNWSVSSFPDVALNALARTGDQSLHKIISSTAAAHISELVKSKEFWKFRMNSDFVFEVLEACAHKIHYLEVVGQSLQKNANILAEDASKAQSIMDDVDKCLEKLVNTARCRNCSSDFGAYIQRTSKCTLRCGNCGCRHT